MRLYYFVLDQHAEHKVLWNTHNNYSPLLNCIQLLSKDVILYTTDGKGESIPDKNGHCCLFYLYVANRKK